MSEAPAADREALAGLVERVAYHSPDTGFCVLRVKVRGHREPVTVVGSAASIQAGEYLQASGHWDQHREHGMQFKAALLRTSPPNTVEGIERYLGSGLIKGIGPQFAKRLVKAFGDKVFDIIEGDPRRLSEVEGIGPVRLERITSGWAEQKVIREIMLFLQSHGVGTARAVRIFKTYGADAVPLVTENPYRLARDIRGIGFKSADQIALKLGIGKTSMLRARAGIAYALVEAINDGHCALPKEDLLAKAEALLEIPQELLAEALALELADQQVVADDIDGRDCVFLPHLWHAEKTIAERLAVLARHALPWQAIEPERAIPWIEARLAVTLAAGQKDAVAAALAAKLLVITGGPGVGKTTIVKSILGILTAKRVRPALAAPTGRAAKRMTESTGVVAKTIHRLLEFDPKTGGFKRGPDNPLDCDLLVVDECSMVDVPLMASLLKALPDRAALILVGDVDQLPSVGPGQVLADLIGSTAIAVARLTEIFRQAAESRIIVNAHRINQGLMPDLAAPAEGLVDFYVVEANQPETAAAKIVEMVKTRIPARFGFDHVRDIQVLCPMNRGAAGARALNADLQKALNPPLSGQIEVERFGFTYRVGDKVMQIENDYDKDCFNGDIGFITAIDGDANEIVIDFDGRAVVYMFGELDEVVLAYATTIHKSQGSEYPAVVIPVMTQHYAMLARNLLYTGVTRGKRLVILVGQKKAVAIAVKGSGDRRRWSKLRQRLAQTV
ncbi:MAG TPA: ATP-dependent RecD-like DNA helicase [Rhodospirillaceae bacterium]|nr:ATP-dependent RecD-like DNA helicase [Rhodospirillaceae bacterium]